MRRILEDGQSLGEMDRGAAFRQNISGDEPPRLPRIGAMAVQAGSVLQPGQSYPQQFVRLVGHRYCGEVTWVRPVAKT